MPRWPRLLLRLTVVLAGALAAWLSACRAAKLPGFT